MKFKPKNIPWNKGIKTGYNKKQADKINTEMVKSYDLNNNIGGK